MRPVDDGCDIDRVIFQLYCTVEDLKLYFVLVAKDIFMIGHDGHVTLNMYSFSLQYTFRKYQISDFSLYSFSLYCTVLYCYTLRLSKVFMESTSIVVCLSLMFNPYQFSYRPSLFTNFLFHIRLSVKCNTIPSTAASVFFSYE